MNVIGVYGGLGNQLFQYAFGQAQVANGIEVSYTPSWNGWKGKHPRRYILDKFCLENTKTSSFLRQTNIVEYNHQFWCRVEFNLDLLKKTNCNFKGYWQYLPYYKDILPALKKEFCIKEEFYTIKFLRLREQIINNNSVSVHVRRTDYVRNKAYHAFPFSYYFKAIQKVKGDLFIFSDDMPWCKRFFKRDYFSRKITFVHLLDYLDFELMKLCKHNISANSSFSYWAALLNDNPDKKVLISGKWLAESQVDNEELHFPKEWIKL